MGNNGTAIVKKLFWTPFILLVLFTAWRLLLNYHNFVNHDYDVQFWAVSYQLIAWFGVFCGFYLAGLWGGYKSIVGRANLAFALGLLMQCFGQSMFSYFFYNGITTPYPSIADVGFFGSIPFYAYGAFMLMRFSTTVHSLKKLRNLGLAFIIPIGMVLFSYLMFLRNYIFDWSQPIKIILDFGYPLGQSIYVSLAILAFLLSLKNLGGVMKIPALLFIFALVMQYISDFTFLYTSNNGTFVGGGIVDYLYLVAYFIMAISLIQIGRVFYKIRET